MKRFTPGLRIEILVSLTVLLAAAMGLTSFVMMRLAEQDLLRHKAKDGLAVIQRMQRYAGNLTKNQPGISQNQIREALQRKADWLAPSELFGAIRVADEEGKPLAPPDKTVLWGRLEEGDIKTVLKTGEPSTRLDRDSSLLFVTAPIFVADAPLGAAQLSVRIDAVAESVKRSQMLIGLYIGLNVLILLIFGNFLLSRIVIRPVQRLVNLTRNVEQDEFTALTPESERDEIAHLRMSLKQMLKRIAQDKEQMAIQIQSLEKANQELKEAREEVLRSEKLSSLGRLAAGVAHEVGNPLGAVLGYTTLLLPHVEKDREAKDYVKRIEAEVSRIDTIVRELLDFSRPSRGEPVPVDISELVSETLSLFSHHKSAAAIELTTELLPRSLAVRADPDQLKQVLINLMFNACDAMEGGGRLTVTTHQQTEQGGGVTISISDTGRGIPESEQNKIFDPFFTTKPPGKGTGLGLAISLRIVESFGGRITVESKEGLGSTFMVTLRSWS